MLDCEGSFNSVEPIRSLSEMEPSGVSVEVTKSCTNKDHCQSIQRNIKKSENAPCLATRLDDSLAEGRPLSGSQSLSQAF